VTLKTPILMQPGGGDSAIPYSALDFRSIADTLVQAEGVIGLGSLKVSQRGAGPNFSVDVAAGFAAIAGDDVALQGKYIVQNTAVVNLAIASPPVSGSRIHRVIARIKDKLHNGSWSTYEWTLEVLADVGSGTPAQPDSAITLALVTVAAGQANVGTANINNQRIYADLWQSRPRSVATYGDLPTNPQDGDRYHITSLSPLAFVWDGTSWRMDGDAATIYKDRNADADRFDSTLIDDDQMTTVLLAGVNYKLTCTLLYSAHQDGDFKWEFDVPGGGGSLHGTALGLPLGSTGNSGPSPRDEVVHNTPYTYGGPAANNTVIMGIEISAKVYSGSGGTFKLKTAQGTTNGTKSILRQHSEFVLTPVSL
jgi:hypothetical protein